MSYIITCYKRGENPTFQAPLSYGYNETDIAYDQLLIRGLEATRFITKQEAGKALAESLRKCDKEGATWQNEHVFCYVKILNNRNV